MEKSALDINDNNLANLEILPIISKQSKNINGNFSLNIR